MMHVYLRWYENGQPGESKRMVREGAAIDAIYERHPRATFTGRTPAVHQPTGGNLAGIDSMTFANDGGQTVADILYPAD